jgi:predicted RNA-binding Zn-ribbon protein involved in translation (DUF1610 family)
MEGYFCPACGHRLTDDHLRAVRLKGVLTGGYFKVSCPFELPAQLGVYGARCHYPGLELQPGAEVDFRCPSCDISFTLSDRHHLSALVWITAEGRRRQVVFNRILGKRMTAVVCLEQGILLEAHGEEKEDLIASLAGILGRLTGRV